MRLRLVWAARPTWAAFRRVAIHTAERALPPHAGRQIRQLPGPRGLRDEGARRRDCGVLSPATSVDTMPATNWHAAVTAYA